MIDLTLQLIIYASFAIYYVLVINKRELFFVILIREQHLIHLRGQL